MRGYKTFETQKFINRDVAIRAFIDNWGYSEDFADYTPSATKFWTFKVKNLLLI